MMDSRLVHQTPSAQKKKGDWQSLFGQLLLEGNPSKTRLKKGSCHDEGGACLLNYFCSISVALTNPFIWPTKEATPPPPPGHFCHPKMQVSGQRIGPRAGSVAREACSFCLGDPFEGWF